MGISNNNLNTDIQRTDDYLAHITSLIHSDTFSRSQNAIRILEYYREKIKQKDIECISEKLLAYEVFGKPLQYDTATDSFVRVIFYRFRTSLTEYYLYEAGSDAIELYFPKGTYVPHFRRRISPCMILPDFQFIEKKRTLHENTVCRLRTLFMLTLLEDDLELIMMYYEGLNRSESTPYMEAIYHEMIVFRRMLFLRQEAVDWQDLNRKIEARYEIHRDEDHVYLPCLLMSLMQKDYIRVRELSKELSEKASYAVYKSFSLLMTTLIESDKDELDKLDTLLQSQRNFSIFWHLPRLLFFLRHNRVTDAFREGHSMNRYPSHLGNILMIVMKRKLNKLSRNDEIFITKKRQYFTREYLSNFLLELSGQYAIYNEPDL